MALWLFKQEPASYSCADLQRDASTLWDGVNNPLARKHLHSTSVGDRVFFYHTGKEKAIVGEMKVIASEVGSVKVEFVRHLTKSVTLQMIRDEPLLAEWELVRLPRLSVMPVTAEQWQKVEELSRG